MNDLINRTISTLSKIQFGEAQELCNEFKMLKLQSLHKTAMLKLRLDVHKNANKHAAAACTALEELDLADEGLELVGLLNQALAEARDELNAT